MRRANGLFLGILAILLLARVALAPVGIFEIDFAAWVAWGEDLWTGDWAHFTERGFNDRLPAVFYLLWFLAGLHHLTGLPNEFLYKLPANLADTALAWLIFRFAARHWGNRLGLVAGLAYALNPFAWHVSTFWGQMDAVQALLLAGTLLLAARGGTVLPVVLLTIATLFKPHSVVLAPLLAVLWWRQTSHALRQVVRRIILAGTTAVVTVWILTAPFVPPERWNQHQYEGIVSPFAFLWDRFQAANNQYPYASVNAFNVWSATGALWASDQKPVAGLTAQTWGMILFCATALGVVLLALRRSTLTSPDLFLAAATLSFLAFTFLTRAHERHVFPAIALLAFVAVSRPMLFGAYLASTAAALVNTLYAYRSLELHIPEPLSPTAVRVISGLPVIICLVCLLALRRSAIGGSRAALHAKVKP